MIVTFTPEETEFLVNLFLMPDAAIQQPNVNMCRAIATALMEGGTVDLSSQDVQFIQYMLQEQVEINGSRHSVANEKRFMGPGTQFVPQRTLILIKSITDKLGASMPIDTATKTDVPDDRRAQGSPQVLQDPRIKPVGIL